MEPSSAANSNINDTPLPPPQQVSPGAALSHSAVAVGLDTRMRTLEHQFATISNTLQQLVQHVTTPATASSASAPASASPSLAANIASVAAPITHVKPPKPSTFNGTTSVQLWLFELQTYFRVTGIEGNARTAFALTLLKGNALQWAHSTARYNDPNAVAWEFFAGDLLHRYNPVKDSIQARNALARIKQTGSLDAYVTAMQGIFQYTPDMHDIDKRHFFIQGLSPSLRKDVIKANTLTYEETVQVAQRMNTLAYIETNNEWMHATQTNATTTTHNNNDEMQLDHIRMIKEKEKEHANDSDEEDEQLHAMYNRSNKGMQQTGKRVTKAKGQLDQKEKERCIREGRCFTCKRTGHNANQCNKKREGWSKNMQGQRRA